MNLDNKGLLDNIKVISSRNMTKEVVKRCVTMLDVTTLDVKDTPKSVSLFTSEVLRKLSENGLPPVASICVTPLFIENVGVALSDTSISITAVVGSFP
ncbi:MAG: deoxyribose-phosphate aldolase, partial [Rikenellaceae bacterium]